MAKRKSNAPLIAAGLLGVGVVGTLLDKMNVFGNNIDKKWWWERIFTPPIVATPVHSLMNARIAQMRRARANRLRSQQRLRNQQNQLVYPGHGAGRPIRKSELVQGMSKYVIT